MFYSQTCVFVDYYKKNNVMYNEDKVVNRSIMLQVTILTPGVMQLFLLININNSLVYQFTETNDSTNFNT